MPARNVVLYALLAAAGLAGAAEPDVPVVDPASIRALLVDGRNPEAETAARALLADTERSAGAEALGVAPVLEVLVETLIANGKGRTDEAVAIARGAQAIRAAKLRADDPEQAWGLDAEVRLRIDRGEYDEGLALAQRSLALREAGNAEEGLIARSLGLVGLSQFYRQDFPTSRALDQRAFDILERVRGPEHLDTLNALNALGADQMRTGALPAATVTFKRLIATYTKLYGAEHNKTAAATTNLAIAYKDMGDFATARPLFQRAIALKEKILGPAHRRLAIDLHNLAVLERDLGNFGAARPLLDRCLAILTATYGAEHPAIANIHTELSIVARGLGDLTTARVHAEKALAIDRAVNQTDDADYLTALGAIEVSDGHLEEAERLYGEALGITEKRMGADHPYVLVTLVNLSGVYLARGVPAKATPLVARIEAIAAAKLVPQDPWYLDTVLVRAEHAAAVGDEDRALRLALESTRLASEQLLLNLRTLPEADALRYIARRPAGMLVPRGLSAATIDVHAAELWDVALGSRALVLDELLARREAARGDARIARAWDAWSDANRRYARQLVVGYDEPAARAELGAAQAAMRATESALAEASSRFDSERRRRALRLPDVTRRLPADTALVAYWRIDATQTLGRDGNVKRFRLGAFVLPADGARALRRPRRRRAGHRARRGLA
jgi:tetratricopeptide (TPR) repeat protein